MTDADEAWWYAHALAVGTTRCPRCGALAWGRYETSQSGQAIVHACFNGHRDYQWVKPAGGRAFRPHGGPYVLSQ